MDQVTLRKYFLLIRAWLFLVLLLLGLAEVLRGTGSGLLIAASATLSPTSKPPLIRVQSNLVRVPVSVTDAGGNAVVDLGWEDFRIQEDGRPMTVAGIAEPGVIPLDLALVLDTSASVRSRFEFELQAAAGFLRRILKPGDRLVLVTIGSHPNLIPLQTRDLNEALHRLQAMTAAAESTAAYDAVALAAGLLADGSAAERRRVQVVFSDGEDNSSEFQTLESALRIIQHADCILYAINPAGGASISLNRISAAGQNALHALAGETGGTAFLPDSPGELEAIFSRIDTELRTQYLLEYYSDRRGDGGFRKIDVHIPDHPELRVRSRQGYYSGNASPLPVTLPLKSGMKAD